MWGCRSVSHNSTPPFLTGLNAAVSLLFNTCAGLNSLANTSAASYLPARLAVESIATAFGAGLAAAPLAANTIPLPTTRGATRVKVRDSQGDERFTPLFFVSPTQINYQLPPSTDCANLYVQHTKMSGLKVTTIRPLRTNHTRRPDNLA